MYKKLTLFLTLMTASFSSYAADTEINLYLISIENELEEGANFKLNNIIQSITAQHTPAFKANFSPVKRTLRDFWHDKHSCLFPASLSAIREKWPEKSDTPLLETIKIRTAIARVYTNRKKSDFKNKQDLKNRKIGVIRGSTLETFANKFGASVTKATSEKQLFSMLASNRIDGALLYDTIAEKHLKMPDYQHISFNPSLEITRTGTRIICHNFPGAEQIIENLSRRIKSLAHKTS
nr:transporter substrate-binding domain-containing protein [Terasakiella pusilla]